MAAGQKPVKALWIRLAPTKTLSQTKPGVDPGGEQQREQQDAARDHSDSVINCHVSLPFLYYLVVANLVLIYTID